MKPSLKNWPPKKKYGTKISWLTGHPLRLSIHLLEKKKNGFQSTALSAMWKDTSPGISKNLLLAFSTHQKCTRKKLWDKKKYLPPSYLSLSPNIYNFFSRPIGGTKVLKKESHCTHGKIHLHHAFGKNIFRAFLHIKSAPEKNYGTKKNIYPPPSHL